MTTNPQNFTPGDTVKFINENSCQYANKPRNRQRVVIEEDLGANVRIKGYNGLFHKDNIEQIDHNRKWEQAVMIVACSYIVFHIVYFIILQKTW